MKLFVGFLIALIAAAAPVSAQDKPALDLTEFFSGRTRGEGILKVTLRRPARHVVNSVGRRGSDGEFILVDTIKEEGKPVKTRRWVMRPSGRNGFTGTLSDAVGPVRVEINGAKATIRYKMKEGGVSIHQVLTMRDRKTLSNVVTGRKLGMRVAHLEGTIRKLD
ncbi:MAG TPA: DUF3833 family protein [Sphingomicrobium sp.]|nr:DUF3833 family protein [Sphingomicrobium sp.]